MSDGHLSGDAPQATVELPVENKESTGNKETTAHAGKRPITRRDVLALCGCGVVGLVAGGVLAKWGVTEEMIASGRIDLSTTPQKMIAVDAAAVSGASLCVACATMAGHLNRLHACGYGKVTSLVAVLIPPTAFIRAANLLSAAASSVLKHNA